MMKKRIDSFVYAFKGIYTLFATQANARIHGAVLILILIFGFYFHLSATEWCLIILASAAVLSAEAMNTALEFVVDLVSPEYHDLAGKAKDVAAAAVLISAIGAAITGFIIFLPKLK
jgi:diacylglycerol kinase